MGAYKRPDYDLRRFYFVIMEGALVVALLIFLVAFKIDLRSQNNQEQRVDKQEVVKMEEIVQTKHENIPPPPPRPQVPVEVPNDELVDDQPLNINAELNMSEKLKVPPPPKNQDEEDEEKVFVVVEQEPELIGGLNSIQQKIKYPEMAQRAGIEGRVFVQFIVDKQGNVKDPVVLRGIGGGCDREALRVVKQAKFRPGMQRGRPVQVRYSLPIVFRLND